MITLSIVKLWENGHKVGVYSRIYSQYFPQQVSIYCVKGGISRHFVRKKRKTGAENRRQNGVDLLTGFRSVYHGY